jgi:hypothetical protein
MGCKALIPYIVATLTHISTVGSGGYIVSLATSATASQDVSGVLWTTYQRRSMGYTNARYGKSKARTGNLPEGCSYASQRLPAPFGSRNWQNFWPSISSQDQFRNFARIGAWKIR